jgi:hypothetical protein
MALNCYISAMQEGASSFHSIFIIGFGRWIQNKTPAGVGWRTGSVVCEGGPGGAKNILEGNK